MIFVTSITGTASLSLLFRSTRLSCRFLLELCCLIVCFLFDRLLFLCFLIGIFFHCRWFVLMLCWYGTVPGKGKVGRSHRCLNMLHCVSAGHKGGACYSVVVVWWWLKYFFPFIWGVCKLIGSLVFWLTCMTTCHVGTFCLFLHGFPPFIVDGHTMICSCWHFRPVGFKVDRSPLSIYHIFMFWNSPVCLISDVNGAFFSWEVIMIKQ